MSLTDFFAPLSQEQFLAEYWETKPLVSLNRDREKYKGLLSLKDIEFLLFSLTQTNVAASHSADWVQFVHQKQRLNPAAYLKKGAPVLDMTRVMEGFQKGTTIILNNLHRRWEPIRKYAEDLEELFGHRVSAYMYLTPPNAQGFDVHYDKQDVLVLQLDGEKLWKIYPDPFPFPVQGEENPLCTTSEKPLYEALVKAGDLLYIPRGYIHEALTTNTHSLHITFAIQVSTWMDLVCQIALQNPSLRKALPMREILKKGSEALDFPELSFSQAAVEQAIAQIKTQFDAARLQRLDGSLLSDGYES